MKEFKNTSELVKAYEAGEVNNWEEIRFCGEKAEIMGMFHRDESASDTYIYLGLLMTADGIRGEEMED